MALSRDGLLAGLLAAVILGGPAAGAADPEAMRLAATKAEWKVLWNDHGRVSFDPVEGVLMRTAKAAGPKETYSALLLAKETLKRPLRNFSVTLTITNEAQLRAGKPNEWEVFWLFFNYNTAGRNLKKTNFLLIQTHTGIQLGKAFKKFGETYLAKYRRPSVRVGQTYRLKVTKTGQHVEVQMDGKTVLLFDGGLLSRRLYDVPGSIGLYCEDSQVRVRDVSIQPLP